MMRSRFEYWIPIKINWWIDSSISLPKQKKDYLRRLLHGSFRAKYVGARCSAVLSKN